MKNMSMTKNYKINFGYGLSPKWYSLRGAKIACQAFMRKSGANWLYVTEFKNGRPINSFLIERSK